jgi:MYXO-CTERM domain-containing protein
MLAACVLATVGERSARGDMMFGGTTNGYIYSIDPSNAATTLVGPALAGNTPVFQFLSSLDFDQSGNLWGIDGRNGNLGIINTANGQTTPVASSGLGSVGFLAGLAINHTTGAAYVSDEDLGSLYSVNLSTGQYTLLGNDGKQFSGLKMDAQGNLYGEEYGTGQIYEVNPNTLATTLVGTGHGSIPDFAVDTDAATLTFFETYDNPFPTVSDLGIYSPSSGFSPIGQLTTPGDPGGRFDGIAFEGQPAPPTPEPSSLTLAGFGLAALGGYAARLRRQRLPLCETCGPA